MTFGDKLKALRLTKGLSQEELASLLGTSKQVISRYENHQRDPKVTTVGEFAKKLNVPLSLLLDDTDASADFPAELVPYRPTHRIPILGRVSAGLPIYVEEHIEGYTYTDLNGGAEYFALRVEGDSMDALHILPGCLVIVRRQDIVENNEIAIVMVNDEDATIKRYTRKENTVVLTPQSTNAAHKTQVYNLKDTKIRICGKVIKAELTPV